MSQSGIPLPSALDLRGRRALVTGATSGIGRATAIVLAQLGAELLLADRASLAEVRAEIERIGATCTTAEGDLTSDTVHRCAVRRRTCACGGALRGDPGRTQLAPRPQLA